MTVYVGRRRLRIADATKPFELSLKIQVGLLDVHEHVIELLDHDPPPHAMLCLRQPAIIKKRDERRFRPALLVDHISRDGSRWLGPSR